MFLLPAEPGRSSHGFTSAEICLLLLTSLTSMTVNKKFILNPSENAGRREKSNPRAMGEEFIACGRPALDELL